MREANKSVSTVIEPSEKGRCMLGRGAMWLLPGILGLA